MYDSMYADSISILEGREFVSDKRIDDYYSLKQQHNRCVIPKMGFGKGRVYAHLTSTSWKVREVIFDQPQLKSIKSMYLRKRGYASEHNISITNNLHILLSNIMSSIN